MPVSPSRTLLTGKMQKVHDSQRTDKHTCFQNIVFSVPVPLSLSVSLDIISIRVCSLYIHHTDRGRETHTRSLFMSFSLVSPRNQNYSWIFSQCGGRVGRNLKSEALEILFARTQIRSTLSYHEFQDALLQFSITHTHSHIERKREPPLSRSHTYTKETKT